jgi:hypothetical protein
MTGAQRARVTARVLFDLGDGLRIEVLRAEGAVQLLLVQRGPKGERLVRGNAFADDRTAEAVRALAYEIERGLRLKASATVAVTVAQWRAQVAFTGPLASARLSWTIPGVNGLPLLLAEGQVALQTPDTLRAVARCLEGLA